MSTVAPPASVLFVGRGGPFAQQLVVTGLAKGFRLHSVATADEALGHLGQVLFDAVVYEARDQATLGRALSADADLARVPTLTLLAPGDNLELADGRPTLALEPDCDLGSVLGWLLRRRPPSEPQERAIVLARLSTRGTSSTVRLLELRAKQVVVGVAPGETLPPLGAEVWVTLPWESGPREGSCAVSDAVARTVTIALW